MGRANCKKKHYFVGGLANKAVRFRTNIGLNPLPFIYFVIPIAVKDFLFEEKTADQIFSRIHETVSYTVRCKITE